MHREPPRRMVLGDRKHVVFDEYAPRDPGAADVRSTARSSTDDLLGMLCAGAVSKAGVVDDTTNNRRYPFYCLVLVLRGRGRYTDDTGECIEVGPGDAIQRLPDRAHSLTDRSR
jgi:hypothetical protein